jgi:hypothetical protein
LIPIDKRAIAGGAVHDGQSGPFSRRIGHEMKCIGGDAEVKDTKEDRKKANITNANSKIDWPFSLRPHAGLFANFGNCNFLFSIRRRGPLLFLAKGRA